MIFDRYPERRRVWVTTRTDRTIAGLLWRKCREYLVLRNAVLMGRDRSEAPMEGEIVILRENVDVIQVL
jgi:small nuclear ribonucleoprotein (snRNP)-like protein